MKHLRVAEVTAQSISIEQFPEGHLWNFAVIHSDDNRRYLSPGDFRPNDGAVDEADTAQTAYTMAEAEAHRRHLVGADTARLDKSGD